MSATTGRRVAAGSPQHAPAPDDAITRLVDAVIVISSDLTLPVVLQRIVRTARVLVDAEYAALAVLHEPGTDSGRLSEFIVDGLSDSEVARIAHPPEGRGILGVLINDPRPLRLHDLSLHPRSHGFPAGHAAMRTFLGVPLRVRDTVFGNLYLTEKRGGRDFTEADEHLVVALAGAAGVAIENAFLQERVRAVAVLEDRERIGRDLHDTVIQRLFATGLELEAAASLCTDGDAGARIHRAIDELDITVRNIRDVIFTLQTAADPGHAISTRP